MEVIMNNVIKTSLMVLTALAALSICGNKADAPKVVEQINKRVNKGQLTLHASNSLRVTKRSS